MIAECYPHEPTFNESFMLSRSIYATTRNSATFPRPDPYPDGGTALIAASENGQDALARLLLEHGANVSLANENGWTALKAASCEGHEAVVRVLVEHGADVSLANDCLLYTSPSPRDLSTSRMPSSA